MAFLKETERSLRAYFFFVGVVSVLLGLVGLGDARELAGMTIPFSWMLAIYVPLISRFILGVGFFIAGLKLKSALLTDPGWIKKLLIGSALLLLLEAALIYTILPKTNGAQLGRVAFGIGIIVYLLHNLGRLTAEAKQRAGVLADPPSARAIR